MNQNIILALVAVFAIVGVSTLAVASTMIGDPTTNEVEYVTVDANAIDVDSLIIGFIPVEKADELTPKSRSSRKILRI
jgi:hypothetical protein